MSKNKQLEMKIQPLSGQRQKGESASAVQACNDWLRMGAGRSLRELVDNYLQQTTFKRSFKPPTTKYGTIRDWSGKFNWSDRASEYDSTWEERKNEEREQVFDHELALDFERVRELKRLASFLEAQIYETGEEGDFHNVWLPDVKQIGSGELAYRVDIERFNSALISEYRAVLDDIAKEVGGRAKKTEVTGKDGGKMQHEVTRTVNAEDLSDDELASLLASLTASSGE